MHLLSKSDSRQWNTCHSLSLFVLLEQIGVYKMTYVEAKKTILDMCCWCNNDNAECIYHSEKRTDLCKKCEFYFALKSIEKQIPKKPKHEHLNYYCSNCNTWLLWDDAEPNANDTFCPKCGQAIDWSEEE